MTSRLRTIAILTVLTAAAASLQHVCAQTGTAYCYIRNVEVTTVSNGVQIQVKSDGILNWTWEHRAGSDNMAAIRFPDARLGVDKTQYDVDEDPVSNVSLATPQNAVDGRGVILTVNMTQSSRVEATMSEDRQTFMLLIYGNRTVEKAQRNGGAATPGKEGSVSVEGDSQSLNVQAIKADIHQVVAEIARKGGLNVAVDDLVKHDISVNVQDCKPLEVIRSIAAGYGLALSSVGDVYMLSEGVPEDLTTYRRSGTASFPMKYLKARDAASLLPTFLYKYVHDNPQQNTVVVTAPSQMLDKIERDLRAIDVPPPMIMIECAVVELTDSGNFDTSFRWQYSSAEVTAGSDSGTGEVGYNNTEALATTAVPTPHLQAWLQALITQGKAEVRAHPSMAAVNGKHAEIFIGSQRFIKVQYFEYGQQQERIETVPVGVRLHVRPWTGGNNEITTDLEVEVSNIAAVDPETGVPRLASRRAQTTMRTVDGDTIVIGGLVQRQEEKTQRRIPFLGSLPLIGPLFRSTTTGSSNTELVILIRPRLLDENGRLPQAEDVALRARFLQPGDLGGPEPTATGK